MKVKGPSLRASDKYGRRCFPILVEMSAFEQGQWLHHRTRWRTRIDEAFRASTLDALRSPEGRLTEREETDAGVRLTIVWRSHERTFTDHVYAETFELAIWRASNPTRLTAVFNDAARELGWMRSAVA